MPHHLSEKEKNRKSDTSYLMYFAKGTCVVTDIIDELVKSGKEIEAVYFASESGLTERFSPVSLLKSYLHNSRKNATTILKNGNYSTAATVCANSNLFLRMLI